MMTMTGSVYLLPFDWVVAKHFTVVWKLALLLLILYSSDSQYSLVSADCCELIVVWIIMLSSFCWHTFFTPSVRPAPFHNTRRLNLCLVGFSFHCLSCVVASFIFLVRLVLFSFFSTLLNDSLGRMSLKWPILVSCGMQNVKALLISLQWGEGGWVGRSRQFCS